MIKHVLTFVSGVLESVLISFLVKIKSKFCIYKVKTFQNCLHQKFLDPNPYKNEKTSQFFAFS